MISYLKYGNRYTGAWASLYWNDTLVWVAVHEQLLTSGGRIPGDTGHYNDFIMAAISSKITGLTIVFSTVHSGADQTKHQSSALLAFVRGIYRGPVNSPHEWPVSRKMFPIDDVIMVPVQDMTILGTATTYSWTHDIHCHFLCYLFYLIQSIDRNHRYGSSERS